MVTEERTPGRWSFPPHRTPPSLPQSQNLKKEQRHTGFSVSCISPQAVCLNMFSLVSVNLTVGLNHNLKKWRNTKKEQT